MTEAQVERWVEKQTDDLDIQFLTSSMTQKEYELKIKGITCAAEYMGKSKL